MSGSEPSPRWPTAEELRGFLRDNVTIVKPGETLIILSPDWMTPNQAREVMDWLNWVIPEGEPYLPFRTIVVPGDGLGTVSDEVVQESLRGLVRDELASLGPFEPVKPVQIDPDGGQ